MQPNNPELIQRIEHTTDRTVANVQMVQRGYTPALRLIVSFVDGSSLFAKIGTDEVTSEWLRDERRIYESLTGSFMPTYVGVDDDGINPILLLEDLSHAHWPPPWSDEQVALVMDALQGVWRSSMPNLPKLAENARLLDGWQQVAEEPEPFLSLGLASKAWLDAALPRLIEIDGPAVASGNSLLHLDLRSDNMCLVGNRAVLIDWNGVCVGNPDFDLGAWLPSLAAEGGPLPETLLPNGLSNSGEIAGLISGYFAARAGLPNIPDAPNVRKVQLFQLTAALPWAMRALDLPPLDGDRI